MSEGVGGPSGMRRVRTLREKAERRVLNRDPTSLRWGVSPIVLELIQQRSADLDAEKRMVESVSVGILCRLNAIIFCCTF